MAISPTRQRAVLTLCRVSNAPTVWSNVLAGWFLAGGGFTFGLVGMLLGATMLYFGGTTLNDAFDAKFDRRYRRERPIPSGVFSRGQVCALGILWMILGSLLMLAGGASDVVLLLLIAAIVSYDAVHKDWSYAPILMGAARCLLVLAAGSAIGLSSLPLWIWAFAHLAYITGLTWLAAGESGPDQGDDHARPQTQLLLSPVGALLLLALFASFSVLSFIFALLAAAFLVYWIAPALPAQSQPLPPWRGIPRLLAAIVIIDVIGLCAVNVPLAILTFAVLLPSTLLLQKRIAAT